MMNNIMEKTQHSCSGCGACVAICPKKVVKIKLNSIGFLTAVVNEAECIQCGLCRKVCNRFKEYKGKARLYDSKLYALQSSNGKIVKRCSSGGVAHELALQAIRNKYKAVGAVYDLDANLVTHKIVNTESEINLLDGSKYLQSNPSSAFYKAVVEARENSNNRFYVFGTPCQVAGLDKVLRHYRIRNQFLLIEIFCHGVPSYKLWEKTCDKISKKLRTNRFDKVFFRYKKSDWHSYCLRVEANGKIYYGARETELFWQVFFENILLNDACYECQARKEFSSADLRLGDYWGARFQNHKDGVSAVFACTPIGEKVIEELICKDYLRALKESNVADMLAAQNMSGYTQQKLHAEALKVLRESGSIKDAVCYYRRRMTWEQKLKCLLLQASIIIPDSIRSKLRKANSSRMLSK